MPLVRLAFKFGEARIVLKESLGPPPPVMEHFGRWVNESVHEGGQGEMEIEENDYYSPEPDYYDEGGDDDENSDNPLEDYL